MARIFAGPTPVRSRSSSGDAVLMLTTPSRVRMPSARAFVCAMSENANDTKSLAMTALRHARRRVVPRTGAPGSDAAAAAARIEAIAQPIAEQVAPEHDDRDRGPRHRREARRAPEVRCPLREQRA